MSPAVVWMQKDLKMHVLWDGQTIHFSLGFLTQTHTHTPARIDRIRQGPTFQRSLLFFLRFPQAKRLTSCQLAVIRNKSQLADYNQPKKRRKKEEGGGGCGVVWGWGRRDCRG